MQTTSVCPACGGEGRIITQQCTSCYGEGIVKGEEVIKINIPAGVGEGMQLNVRGKGNAARRGGSAGDLLVAVSEIEHEHLMRDGNDLLYNLFISIPEAALGTTAEIPGIESRIKMRIEAGTQPGKILRLRGKGLPDINGDGRGDLLVKVNVWIPKSLSREEKKTLEDLSKSDNFTPNPGAAEKNFFKKMREMFD